MPYQDFRQFLDMLRKHGELVDIDRPIDLRADVAKALKQSCVRKGPALLFSQSADKPRFNRGDAYFTIAPRAIVSRLRRKARHQ